MDPAAAQVLVQYLIDQRTVVDYMYITAFALLYYDWLITLYEEIQLVWLAEWNYTKVLFLLSRYIPMVSASFLLRNQLGLDVDWTLCGKYYQAASWLVLLALTFSEIILCVRTWAVWRRNRAVGFLLVVLLSFCMVLDAIYADRFLKSLQIVPGPYTGYRGCFITKASNIIYINYVLLTIIDIVVLSLMGISAWKSYRQGNTNELSLVVHRDGILFYLYLLVTTIGNLIIMLAAPPAFEIILTPLQGSFYSIFSCRIVLNIRRAAKGTSGQLHTTRDEDIRLNTMAFGNANSTLLLVDDDQTLTSAYQ